MFSGRRERMHWNKWVKTLINNLLESLIEKSLSHATIRKSPNKDGHQYIHQTSQ